MRFFDRWIWVFMVGYVLFSAATGMFEDAGPQTSESGEIIALPRNLPVVSLEGPGHRRGGNYIGTAFAVGSSDDWITARHVTEGCSRLTLIEHVAGSFDDRYAVSGNVLHKSADVARLDSQHPPRGQFALVGVEDGRMPVNAWGHGFPQGQSAWVELEYLGPVAVDDRRSGTAYGAAWHVKRYPQLPVAFDLGGLSGGPLIDEQGRVRGIIVGSDPRRARLVTIDPLYGQALSDAMTANNLADLPTLSPTERDHLLKDNGLIRLVDCRS